jgi:hypothetical protein
MVDLKGGGPVGNGESGANRLLNNFSLSNYDNAWYLDSISSSSRVSYTTWSRNLEHLGNGFFSYFTDYPRIMYINYLFPIHLVIDNTPID